jgi:hypothetical protein
MKRVPVNLVRETNLSDDLEKGACSREHLDENLHRHGDSPSPEEYDYPYRRSEFSELASEHKWPPPKQGESTLQQNSVHER